MLQDRWQRRRRQWVNDSPAYNLEWSCVMCNFLQNGAHVKQTKSAIFCCCQPWVCTLTDHGWLIIVLITACATFIVLYKAVLSVFYFLYFQPQLEGFFACLDIWTVFLDYLIGKVANARSDKLAEAEATVSRSVLTYIHCFFAVKVGMYFDKNVKLRILLSF